MNRYLPAGTPPAVTARSAQLIGTQERKLHVAGDLLFAWLLIFQWAGCIIAAVLVSPRSWMGAESQPHVHVYMALLLGGLVTLPPVALAWFRPGRASTRHAIAVAEACTCGLLIHFLGGRLEAHFQVFGVLAFLAFYRDWRVLLTASAVIALDHMLRGVFWPQSIFGVVLTSSWRWLEHAGWVVFEVAILTYSCVRARHEVWQISSQRAQLEATTSTIEAEVRARTQELVESNAELERTVSERNQMEVQLHQAQRLEAVGQLAAGVAHEINTPIQYVGDNTRFLKEAFEDYASVLAAYGKLAAEELEGGDLSEPRRVLDEALEGADPEYLAEEIPRAIGQSLEGIERVTTIVKAMKEFSHPGVEEKTLVDLNQAIQSTMTVCRHEWKYSAEIELSLDPELPEVQCFADQVGQVLLNLIVNAAHAIGELGAENSEDLGWIRISTSSAGDFVELTIEDSGPGVPDEIRERVFDPFFTTKPVGKGTGQGLAIAHNVIVSHGGTLTLHEAEGGGAKFLISLPITSQDELQVAA